MWLFNKKLFRRLTEEDENEEKSINGDELPTFEPEILSEAAARTKEAAKEEKAQESAGDVDENELPYMPETHSAPRFKGMHFPVIDVDLDDDEDALDELPDDKTAPAAPPKESEAQPVEETPAPKEEPAKKKKAAKEEKARSFWEFDEFGELEEPEKPEKNEEKKKESPEDVVNIAPAEQLHFPDEFDVESTPGDIYARLKALPFTARAYALSGDRLYLFHPDGKGRLYLFEQFGDFDIVSPADCAAFIKISSFGGSFRGTTYTTSDLEYIIRQRSWQLSRRVYDQQAYKEALDDGFEPCKKPDAGKGMLMTKSVSLYRLKDLHLTAEVTVPGTVTTSETYRIDLPRTLLEATDGEKPYKKLCMSVIKLVTEQVEDPFFTAQILKARRNLAVCFPLEGAARTGDFFAGGVVTAAATLDNGTMILQIGNDQNVRLPVKEDAIERGQHRLTLIDENVTQAQ